MATKLTGIQKQDAFLTGVYSRPLLCPYCNNYHSYIEARGSSDWSQNLPAKCPVTDQPLIHNVALIGGEDWFTMGVEQGRVMTAEEEQAWQALDDNADWMTDEQYNHEAKKLRKKYNP